MKTTTQLTWSGLRMVGVWLLFGVLAAITAAGGDTGKTQQQLKAALEAHQGEFDYLLGDWQFTANSKQFGRMKGYWSAVKLGDGGQVLDEFRVVGDKGQTLYSSLTLRVYNPYLERWELVTLDRRDGLQNFGTARREGPEMLIEQKFGAVTPEPSLWHIRYHDIKADYFSWSADRSKDEGKTWQKDFETIEAKRIGPPRTMEPLTAGHKATASVLP
ncbi:MAG TPA: hypothetical protein VE377_18820 [Candidatus Dormibacteraeota bacterium]|nr:hypothetical protein [Candidatus Dormibacteraeota bacterium]